MKLQSLALPFLSLLGIGHAYVLSTDCPSDKRTLIKSKIDAAFARIDKTATELNKVATNAPDKIQAVADSAEFLFNSGDLPGIVTNLRQLYGASRFSTRGDGTDLVDKDVLPMDAIIYCGGARFKNILDTRPGAAPNTQVFADSVHYFEAGDFYDRCFNKNDIEMYTSTAPDDSIQKPSVVQICPWYLDKFLNPPAQKKCNAWQKKLKSVVDTLGMAHKTAADGSVDFVHTTMHELTHTKAGGRTNDSAKQGISGWLGQQLFNKDSYGWSNCVGLKSASNADSIAILGTMVESITTCGLAPTKGGDMNPIPGWTAPLRRLIRSLPSKKQLRAWIRQASSM